MVQHILFFDVVVVVVVVDHAVFKVPSHSRACFKRVHENTNN